MEAYEASERDFGENRPQEMVLKQGQLPEDIRWHQIGTLQRNKVKYIAPFVSMIHSVDSVKLLDTIQKEAQKNNRIIDILFEIHIAQEQSKEGWQMDSFREFCKQIELRDYPNVNFRGLMGMATYTDQIEQIRSEFYSLKECFESLKPTFENFDTLSMGMSGDYQLAIECGSNMVRIGTTIFGNRNYK